jgi:hypothetical protein
MKNNLVMRILVPATYTMALCFLLASGVSAVAQSANGESGNGRCSNRTLSGDYGFALDGMFLPNTPFRGVVMQHYDGNGNITQVDHTTPAGTIYLHFVVVNNGKQINQVVDSNAVTAVGIKVN